MHVYLTQCVCPQRHALLALAFEAEHDDLAKALCITGMIPRMEGLFARGVINRHCGICGATELAFEMARTPFRTIDEAMPNLREIERMNLFTRLELDAKGESHDVRRKN